MSESLVADRGFYMQNQLNSNTADIKHIVTQSMNVHHTLNMVQTILCGLLAFSLLDRVTGTWTVTNRKWAIGIVEALFGTPYFFFILNIGLWLALGAITARMITSRSRKTAMYTQVKVI